MFLCYFLRDAVDSNAFPDCQTEGARKEFRVFRPGEQTFSSEFGRQSQVHLSNSFEFILRMYSQQPDRKSVV